MMKMTPSAARTYCEQFLCHLDEGGKFNAINMREALELAMDLAGRLTLAEQGACTPECPQHERKQT